MTDDFDIQKAGAIFIHDRKVLAVRDRGEDRFMTPGGKCEDGETLISCLLREVREEVSVEIDIDSVELLGSFHGITASAHKKKIRIDAFLIGEYSGSIEPSSEIEEVCWVDTSMTSLKLGSILEHNIMPLLKQRDLID